MDNPVKKVKQKTYEEKIQELQDNFKSMSDDDISAFCVTNGIKLRDAYKHMSEWRISDDCKGCKYIDFYYNNLPPCRSCPHSNKKKYAFSVL